jgi:two-component system OmpR family sensor kinase
MNLNPLSPEHEPARQPAHPPDHQPDLKARLEDLQAQFQAFAHTVSHDLRAPLRHILAFTDLALEDLAEHNLPQVQSHLTTVTRSARLLANQMDGLMALTQAERAPFNPAPIRLPELVHETCQALVPTIADRTLQWQIAPNLPTVWADASMVRQVLNCLLSNAVKFTRKQNEARVEINWQAHDDGLCTLSIKDNGVGFNPAKKDSLFQAFARLHSPNEFEGVGTGLALTRRLVQRHGGKVWADAQPDAGCTVSFQLPLTSGIQN